MALISTTSFEADLGLLALSVRGNMVPKACLLLGTHPVVRVLRRKTSPSTLSDQAGHYAGLRMRISMAAEDGGMVVGKGHGVYESRLLPFPLNFSSEPPALLLVILPFNLPSVLCLYPL